MGAESGKNPLPQQNPRPHLQADGACVLSGTAAARHTPEIGLSFLPSFLRTFSWLLASRWLVSWFWAVPLHNSCSPEHSFGLKLGAFYAENTSKPEGALGDCFHTFPLFSNIVVSAQTWHLVSVQNKKCLAFSGARGSRDHEGQAACGGPAGGLGQVA